MVETAHRRFFARQCQVLELDDQQARSFLRRHHRQGPVSVAHRLTSIALTYEGETLAVAQFCYPRTDAMKRQYSVELLRMAFKEGVRVVGGASRLIHYYKKTRSPADIFTYQDATGELTSVYEHCGFTLVSQAKKKQYLVAPGKTLATASRKEALGMAYATRYGPDRILGTKLGEVVDPETGKRKSNRRIFLEDLGWHLEETPGDRVYEWVDPNRTYYTYRITAADSDKYYFGVSHVKKGKASVEDCLKDGYWGSGDNKSAANKFLSWKRKHRSELRKEIVELHRYKARAFVQESELVGDLWKTDPLCLNSCAGGRAGAPSSPRIAVRSCPIHGETKFRGDSCYRCFLRDKYSLDQCLLHGETKFAGGECLRCQATKQKTLRSCPKHGLTKHKGSVCYSCEQESIITTDLCPVHGEATYQGGTCSSCTADKAISVSTCPTHGETKFHGTSCYACETEARIQRGHCPVHGEVVLYGGKTCARCANDKRDGMKLCPIHGECKHAGDRCRRCAAEKTAHTRFHRTPRANCSYCENEGVHNGTG